MNDRLLSFLGLCRRAGKMKIGCDTVIESVEEGNACLVLMARDISENTKKKVTSALNSTDCEILNYSKDELSFSLGKTCAVLAVEDEGFAKKLKELIRIQSLQGGETE
ncbi:MAG: ribosomal L7Ae/L30e/S12e/Gadd45 family protein [Clostridia bacterium]|nr:ribosomal L7Ae/L30e/S12e/Gadd45 family protein [Clostridia bacterium]